MPNDSGFVVPFPLPTWAGVASISGRTITRISGSSFTDGYPGIGLILEIDPSVIANVVSLPGGATDQFGRLPDAFCVWYLDGDHLATDVDATYDLLIPPGSTGAFRVADYMWPQYNSAICYGSGSVLESNPNQTIRDRYPAIHFGGNSFHSGASNLTAHPSVFIHAIQVSVEFPEGQYGVAEYGLSAVNSSTAITVNGSLPTGVYQVKWLAWGTSPPAIDAPYLKSFGIVGALPVGSAAGMTAAWQTKAGGLTVYCGDHWQFFAQVRGNTAINTGVTWSCSGPGSINSSTGVYTAPSSSGSGSVTVTATSAQDGSTTSLTFGLLAQTAATVDINPSSYTPPAGWKLSGGPGMLVSTSPYLERWLIVPA